MRDNWWHRHSCQQSLLLIILKVWICLYEFLYCPGVGGNSDALDYPERHDRTAHPEIALRTAEVCGLLGARSLVIRTIEIRVSFFQTMRCVINSFFVYTKYVTRTLHKDCSERFWIEWEVKNKNWKISSFTFQIFRIPLSFNETN